MAKIIKQINPVEFVSDGKDEFGRYRYVCDEAILLVPPDQSDIFRDKYLTDLCRNHTLSERIRIHRMRICLSQKDLSERAGISQSEVSAIERGNAPGARVIKKLMKALNVDFLFFEK